MSNSPQANNGNAREMPLINILSLIYQRKLPFKGLLDVFDRLNNRTVTVDEALEEIDDMLRLHPKV